jgi:rfaE bifunctional protein kinase chain/domain
MKIAVIGDVMLDQYKWCQEKRNPEHKTAPCGLVKRIEYRPGGAGNAASNLLSLGADVFLIGLIGKDENAEKLRQSFSLGGLRTDLIEDPGRPTILKERIMIEGKYDCRVDIEDPTEINSNHVQDIARKINGAGIILISDYEKGMISEGLMNNLKTLGIPIIVDPKPAHKEYYEGVFLVKPNSLEAIEMTGIKDDVEAARKLVEDLGANILLTRGENGIAYFGRDGTHFDFPIYRHGELVDVVGAGDTAIATFTHFLSKGKSIEECVRLANRAAGVAVTHAGCYQVSEKEVLGE